AAFHILLSGYRAIQEARAIRAVLVSQAGAWSSQSDKDLLLALPANIDDACSDLLLASVDEVADRAKASWDLLGSIHQLRNAHPPAASTSWVVRSMIAHLPATPGTGVVRPTHYQALASYPTATAARRTYPLRRSAQWRRLAYNFL